MTRIRDAMAGGVAHDLNNILSGIVAYPDLLLRKLPTESDLRKPIEAIQQSGKRAAEVVGDLLTVARGSASQKEITNLNKLVIEYLYSPEGQTVRSGLDLAGGAAWSGRAPLKRSGTHA